MMCMRWWRECIDCWALPPCLPAPRHGKEALLALARPDQTTRHERDRQTKKERRERKRERPRERETEKERDRERERPRERETERERDRERERERERARARVQLVEEEPLDAKGLVRGAEV